MNQAPSSDRIDASSPPWPQAPRTVRKGSSDDPALVLAGVSRSYGPVTIIDDVGLTIGRGEIVALVGHSGSGKSTLLRIIAGLDRPQRGTVTIGGRQVFGSDGHIPTERRGVGMVFQDYALFPHLSVLDNVKFGLARKAAAKADAEALAALERVGLAKRASDFPHALSGGEQQRVALIRALMPGPQILLMDEPFSNLDRRNRARIRDETARILRDSGTTVIIVTHEPDDAIRMTDRVMLLESGRIVQDGPSEILYRHPTSLVVARFFSDFNELPGVSQGGVVDTPIGRFAATGVADGTQLVVCLRPHDIHVDDATTNSALRGTVTSHSFIRDEQLVTLWVPGLTAPLQVRAPVHIDAAIGDQIGFHLRADDALVFPAID